MKNNIDNDKTPDAPEAPVHYGNQEASAWQSGWGSGYDAYRKNYDATLTLLRNTVDYQYVRIREVEAACESLIGPQGVIPVAAEIRMQSPHIVNNNMWCWEIRNMYNVSTIFASGKDSDPIIAYDKANESFESVKSALEPNNNGTGVERVKRWKDRVPVNDTTVQSDEHIQAMQDEIESLRAYAKGLEAGADHLNRVVMDLRAKQPSLPKPVAYRYSTSGMWEFTTNRNVAVTEREQYEKYHSDDPDLEHEEPEALFTEDQVKQLLSGRAV